MAERLQSSFRDPSGFLYTRGGTLYRQVNRAYQAQYDHLMTSGLYAAAVKAGWLIPHEETDAQPGLPDLAYKVIQPERVAFISYPYEWSFSQLKDAALVTLALLRKALEFNMVIKDASAYNIQFHRGRATLIDTLSFDFYEEGSPWVAYRQFCQHFLAPLALMAHTDVRLSQLLRIYIDGVPLDLASKLLPAKTRWNLGLSTHLHLHARMQQKNAGKALDSTKTRGRINRIGFLGLIDSLESTVKGLNWKPAGTEWADYYQITNYSDAAFDAKKALVADYLKEAKPETVWDLGSNNGEFSRIASEQGIETISADIDPAAVEQNYRIMRSRREKHLLPLVIDLTNPSPDLGWGNQERDSLTRRGPAGLVMALALIHHLAISNNVPLLEVARYFAALSEWLIIEFVPKIDSQVQILLSSREDIFPDYQRDRFEEIFKQVYRIVRADPIEGSQRTLYLMRRR